MIEEIRRLLGEIPFRAFVIVTNSGQQYHVKSLDHIGLGPNAKTVAVWHDDGTVSLLSPLHIDAVEGAVLSSSLVVPRSFEVSAPC